MDERTRRIGENEALFRTVNEEIESLSRGIAAVGGRIMHIVCECGDLACTERLAVQVGDYERIRREPALFFIRPGVPGCGGGRGGDSRLPRRPQGRGRARVHRPRHGSAPLTHRSRRSRIPVWR